MTERKETRRLPIAPNPYGHPHADELERLHDHAVSTFWTNVGSGVAPAED
jgi:hypothetical protein